MSVESNRKRRHLNLFTNDIRALMFAYGGAQDTDPESVSILEDILEEYIIDLCHEAARMARSSNRNKVKVEDFKFALRNDYRKLGRIDELHRLSKLIRDARKTFDDSEGKSMSKMAE
ncbi:transcription initiation factor IID, 18kD subunit-domain-containing protein [Lipomyces oligophaga]|uniref:transcription initiation factor IID, 18kD subunit-domain-containing protein n=1 Tax=Lipomyces oligophaga TaxID=45792 RepID=UPI0034CFD2F0